MQRVLVEGERTAGGRAVRGVAQRRQRWSGLRKHLHNEMRYAAAQSTPRDTQWRL